MKESLRMHAFPVTPEMTTTRIAIQALRIGISHGDI
jgi:hypothetical protein